MTEPQIRKLLAKQDLRLIKNRAHSKSREFFGVGYMVVDAYRNTVVLGSTTRPFDATLDDVAALVA